MSASTNAHTHNFDTLSSHPIHPAAKQALANLPDYAFLDPTKLYRDSRSARLLLDSARASIAARLKVNPDEVSFIPSGNAGLDITISGLINSLEIKTIVSSAVEQKALLERVKKCEHYLVPVNNCAQANTAEFISLLESKKPGLAILQLANHEVGTTQLLAPVYEKCKELNIPLLVDATMGAGLVELGLTWDVLLLKPSSWGAPGGLDILVVKRNTKFKSILLADGRENHKFSNDVLIPHAVAIGASFEAITLKYLEISKQLFDLVTKLRTELESNPKIQVLGDPMSRLPHVLALLIKNIDGEALVTGLSKKGFDVSSGSSCTPDEIRPSHVLAAMGLDSQAHLRISLPFDCVEKDIKDFVMALNETIIEIENH
jgi:cysteine desulfurase